MNRPYVKEFKNGILQNPIGEGYFSPYENRKSRRARKPREKRNGKGFNIHILGDTRKGVKQRKVKVYTQVIRNKQIVHFQDVDYGTSNR